MAIDPGTLLQFLMQMQGGGAPPISPTSGLDEPSLSGLRLGEQGMGLGGGGSLLGGSPGAGGGGAGGPGLDLLTLLNQLTQGTGAIGAPSQSLLTGIGGGVEPSFGAGGVLIPQQGGVPQGTIGQAGLGGGQSAATALGLLKEALGLSKTLLGGSKTASPAGGPGGTADILRGGLPNIPDVTLGGSLGQSPFFGGGLTPSDLSLLTGTQPFGGTGLTPGELSQLTGTSPPNLLEGIGTPGNLLSLGGVPGFPTGAVGLPGPGGGTFSEAGNIIPGLPSLGAGGAATGGELAAQFGAQGGGEFGLANLAGGGAGAFSLGNILPGLGVLGNVGSGILGLTQGNIAGGAGTLGGTAAGLGLGAALAPETLGLSLLLGGLGGSAGGLLGSLFGGFGSPSVFEARRKNVGPTAQAGESALTGGLTRGLDATPGIQSVRELFAALGVPTPDTFGGARNPVAVSLSTPGGVLEFNPMRAVGGSRPVTPEIFSQFLNEVRGQIPAFQAGEKIRRAEHAAAVAQRQSEQAAFDQRQNALLARQDAPFFDESGIHYGGPPPTPLPAGPFFDASGSFQFPADLQFEPSRPLDIPALAPAFPAALNRIMGSGDVAFQNQAASEAQAARVRTTAQNAILQFLLGGLPSQVA